MRSQDEANDMAQRVITEDYVRAMRYLFRLNVENGWDAVRMCPVIMLAVKQERLKKSSMDVIPARLNLIHFLPRFPSIILNLWF